MITGRFGMKTGIKDNVDPRRAAFQEIYIHFNCFNAVSNHCREYSDFMNYKQQIYSGKRYTVKYSMIFDQNIYSVENRIDYLFLLLMKGCKKALKNVKRFDLFSWKRFPIHYLLCLSFMFLLVFLSGVCKELIILLYIGIDQPKCSQRQLKF